MIRRYCAGQFAWYRVGALCLAIGVFGSHSQEGNLRFPWFPRFDVPSGGNTRPLVYPTGAIMLYWNRTEPIRYASMGSGRPFRANLNFVGEEIQVALIIRGSDGKFYSNVSRQFPQEDGWICAAARGVYLDELRSLDAIRCERWGGSRTHVRLDIKWYEVDSHVVDRETQLTPRSSPYPPGTRDRQGRSFIRYYLAKIRYKGEGWSETWVPQKQNPMKGMIIAPIVLIEWQTQSGSHSMWLPSNQQAPMPGMTDCLRLSFDGSCSGAVSEPVRGSRFGQYFAQGGRGSWGYTESLSSSAVWHPSGWYIGYPCQYPIFVFGNLNEPPSHSKHGIRHGTTVFIPYDTPIWWRLHRATLYSDVPYEWGGKVYHAQVSGDICSFNPNGTNNGFGLDCSGLIALAKGEYNATRYGTEAIRDETVHISWERVRPGDLFLRHGVSGRDNHVMLVLRAHWDPQNGYRYTCIEAVGADANETMERLLTSFERVRVRTYSKYWLEWGEWVGQEPNRRREGGDFSPRRFRGDPND